MSQQAARQARLRDVTMPEFGIGPDLPELPLAVYQARIGDARARAAERGLDVLLVYGDREHCANIAYLSGYDPRFEDALLAVPVAGGDLVLAVGNEGFGYAGLSPVPHDRVLFQPFSLLNQPRGASPALTDVLHRMGVQPGAQVGIAGWTYAQTASGGIDHTWIEAPAYLVDAVRVLTGVHLLNATEIFMNPRDGLRTINEVDQLAIMEFAAATASDGVRRILRGLRPGMTELEAMGLAGLNGFPLSCHPMLTAGPRASAGLASPGTRRIGRGEYFTCAIGLRGALTSRAGWLVADAPELPPEASDYLDRLVVPYFQAAAAWYETLGLGVTGGALHDAVHRHLGDPFFNVTLNTGHTIHIDEWVSSPVFAGSDIPLRSGTALQCDIIPATGTPYGSTNIEDGVALADAALRDEFAAKYPSTWARIQARRAFMRDEIGLRLAPEVLPFSNMAAALPPFLLRPERVMSFV